ncbi:MAG TPA: hypothetical protein VH299_00210 [Solirubrobacterales bacterium]|nr:hypothetical protein [Solirubrobacterales bacterium]
MTVESSGGGEGGGGANDSGAANDNTGVSEVASNEVSGGTGNETGGGEGPNEGYVDGGGQDGGGQNGDPESQGQADPYQPANDNVEPREPANDNVASPEAVNDNSAPVREADDGVGDEDDDGDMSEEDGQEDLEDGDEEEALEDGGKDHSDGGENPESERDEEKGEPRDDRDEAEKHPEALERLGAYLHALVTVIGFTATLAIDTLDVQINSYENHLQEIAQTHQHPGPGEQAGVYEISPEEQQVQVKLEKARNLRDQFEISKKILDPGDAEDPMPEKPDPYEGLTPPVAALVQRPPRVANDNNPPGIRPS